MPAEEEDHREFEKAEVDRVDKLGNLLGLAEEAQHLKEARHPEHLWRGGAMAAVGMSCEARGASGGESGRSGGESGRVVVSRAGVIVSRAGYCTGYGMSEASSSGDGCRGVGWEPC